jgi:O-antigen/teichoic acid export membrane protein
VIELSRVYLLVIPFGMILGHAASILRSQLQIATYNRLILIVPLGYTLGVLALTLTSRLTVTNSVLLMLVFHITAVMYSVYLLVSFRLVSRLSISLTVMRQMISYGVRVHVGTLFSAANLRLDQVLLAAWAKPEQLGLYVIAVKVAEIGSVLTTAVTTVAVPKIARHTDTRQRLEELSRIFEAFLVVSVMIKFLFAVIVPVAIPFVYGNEFKAAIPASEILVLASLFFDAKAVLTGGSQALNTPWLASRAELVSSLVTVILLFMLLPILGIVGAALTSLIAYALSAYLILRGLKRQHGLVVAELFRLDHGAQALLGWLRGSAYSE